MANNYKRNYNRSKGRSYGAEGKKRNYSSKSRSKKKGFSLKNIRAYWIGVGLSAARDMETRSDLLETSSCKDSVRAGYQADNTKDISRTFRL